MDILNEDKFESEISNGMVVVDCFAPWCGPCKTLIPILSQLEIVNPNVKFYKVDVTQSTHIAEKYNIGAVPTLLFFKDGKQVKMMQGVHSNDVLQESIDAMSQIV